MDVPPLRAAAPVALTLLLLVTGMSEAALAAKSGKKGQRDRQPEQATPTAPISVVKGKRYKVLRALVAPELVRIADPSADQATPSGEPAADAPAWTDIAAGYVAPTKMPRKLYTKMRGAYPRGTAGSFYGADADWQPGDPAIFVSVELADGRPRSDAVQQVEVGLDGDAATPVQPASAADTRAGVETFSLSGRFSNGSESSGTTDVSGRQPGGEIEYYNAESGVFGLYDPRTTTYYLVVPRPRDARSVAVTLRSRVGDQDIIDRLELPGGGHLVPLEGSAAGFDAAPDSAPLGCRAIETFASAASVLPDGDPSATAIRYTAGAGSDATPAQAAALLAALDGRQTVPLELRPVNDDGEAQPLAVDAQVAMAPALRAVSLTMPVPRGQWSVTVPEAETLVTPAGESLIDHTSLTGRAGILTGAGLDGFVAGDPACGSWDIGVADACELVPADGMAALTAADPATIEQAEIRRADGSTWCVGRLTDTEEARAKYIVRIGRGRATAADVQSEAAGQPDCEALPLEAGAGGLTIDCGAQGMERFAFLVTPQATAADDPEGGLLVSVDLAVDPSRPSGERYDGAAATALLTGMADSLAATSGPARTHGAAVEEPAAEESAAEEPAPEDSAAEEPAAEEPAAEEPAAEEQTAG